MPAEKNKTLRVVVPAVVAILGIVLVSMVYLGATKKSASGPATPTSTPASAPAVTSATTIPQATPVAAEETVEAVAKDVADVAQATDAAVDPAAAATTAAKPEPVAAEVNGAAMGGAPAGALGQLRARAYAFDPATPAAIPAPIGSLDPQAAFSAEVTFTLTGAGVQSIILADHYTAIDRKTHYPVQQIASVTMADGSTVALTSLAAREIEVEGQFVNLYSDAGVRFWREIGVGRFESIVEDDSGAPVIRVLREYTLAKGSYEIQVAQSCENLTDRALRVRWRQYGPIDLPEDVTGYGLDVRRMRFGHLLSPAQDPSRQFAEADTNLTSRGTIISNAASGSTELWPDTASHAGAGELVWLAQTSRYFAFAVHPLISEAQATANLADMQASPLDKQFYLGAQAHALVWGNPGAERVLVQLTTAERSIAPRGKLDLSFAAYAGPLGREQLSPSADPVFGALGISELLIYNLGGMCAFCTFQPLARGLLAFLAILHDYIVHDWAIAIMFLVVCVRGVLHPVTRKSQIAMTLFGRKMQALAPKQAKIRERYKDDPKRMQQEMIRLMKEEKVSYAGALGCLPMFLQTPVWIALYAMLYFSFELRHQPAFYGIFQAVSGGGWSFMGDLSAADHFIDFGRTLFTLPLFGHVTGFNVLPLLLGVVFYMQQKYLTPPTASTMTPEQQQQQKIMKVMMVVMFPVLMYNAPCGLTVYFITNSVLGIMESKWIRAHVDQLTAGHSPDDPVGSLGRKKVSNTASAKASGPSRGPRPLDEPKRFKER